MKIITLLLILSATGLCDNVIKMETGNLIVSKDADDLCVGHIDIQSLPDYKIINDAENEIKRNPLKNLSFQELSLKARQRNVEAQYLLGCKYHIGDTVKQDRAKAVNYYRQAAMQGHAQSQFILGELFSRSNQEKAAEWFLRAANQELVTAQCKMAYLYKFGYGVKQDYQEAFKWYLKALQQDSAEAWINIGNLYYYGKGTEQNHAEAFNCFSKSLDFNVTYFLPYLHYRLGYMYQHGLGTETDYEKAIQSYHKAANFINSDISSYAFFRLGNIYEYGLGTDKNIDKAVKWYVKAAEQRHEQAQLQLRKIDPTFQLNISEPLSDVSDLIITAKYGDAEAQCELGSHYLFGLEGFKEDPKEALKWYLKAAEQGHEGAQTNLVNIYYSGEGTEQNYNEAMAWALKAVENGNTTLFVLIGTMYLIGQGVEKDLEEAEAWFIKAVENGNAINGEELFRLGLRYAQGKELDENPAEAFRWVLKAAEIGDPKAQYYIGRAYLEGRGIEKNDQTAYDWFRKSANTGQTSPCTYYCLGIMCSEGRVVEKDLIEGYKWFLLASKPSVGPWPPNYIQLLNEKDRNDLTIEQKKEILQTIDFCAHSGLYVPDLPEKLNEIKMQMSPKQIEAAEKRVEGYLEIQKQKQQEKIKRFNT